MSVNIDWAKRISQVSEQLTRIETELLTYITKNPHTAAFMSLKDLCGSTDVSKPKVIDFYRKLGYLNFKEFRGGILEFYEQHINSYQASSATFRKIGTLEELLNTAIQVDINSLNRLVQQISTEDLQYVSNSLLDAERIYIYGPGTGFYPAHFLYQRLKRYRLDVHLVGTDPMHLAEDLFPLTSDDVLVFFHYSHEESREKNIMEMVGDTGARIIMVTEHIHHRFVEWADRILYVNRGEVEFKNSMAVPMHFANLLLLAIEFAQGPECQRTLKELENKRDRYHLSF